ncbi:MAG: cytochrome c, partial [Planctomycetota bacterium]
MTRAITLRRVAVLVGLILAGSALLPIDRGRADEGTPREPSAERGYRHLLETAFLPAGFDNEVFDHVWRTWPDALRERAEAATADERRDMAFERYGFVARPEDPTLPLQFVVDDEGGWHMNCFACHGGRVAGRTIPGLPNTRFAFQTLHDEIVATKRELGRPLGPGDLAGALVPFGRTVGTTNAVVFGMLLLQWRDADLNVVPPSTLPRLPHHDLDAPPWWHYRRRTHLYIDGTGKRNHRTLMQFILVPVNDRERVLAHEEAFRDIE